MLDIVITSLTADEGVVIIKAMIIEPQYLREPALGPEDKEALELHYQRQTVYKRLRLGNAILSQAAVE